MADAASDWKGKVAVVTGAAMGIGYATAELFARLGAHAVLMDVDPGRLTEATQALRKSGLDVSMEVTDVSDERQIAAAINRVAHSTGRIDALVNNAGIMRRHSRLQDWTAEEFRRVIDVNLTSHFLMTKSVEPMMVRQGGGAVVNISSVGGLIPVSHAPAYAAAKAGVIGLTRSTAELLAPAGIRVNAVLPSLVDTPMTRDSPSRGHMEILKPLDIARAILHVAAQAAWSGKLFRVDPADGKPRMSEVIDPPGQVELNA